MLAGDAIDFKWMKNMEGMFWYTISKIRIHKTKLEKIVKSGMSPVSIVYRTKILLLKDGGMSSESIAELLGVNSHTVDLWVKKYCQKEPEDSIMDVFRVAEG